MFEVFLWTDERDPVYFEYEISPLGRELPIMVPNIDGKFLGWLPWHYEGDRKIRKATSAIGGEVKSGRGGQGLDGGGLHPVRTAERRCGTCRRSPARAGGRTSTAWTTTTASTPSWDWSRVGAELPRVPEVRHAGVRMNAPGPARTEHPTRPGPRPRARLLAGDRDQHHPDRRRRRLRHDPADPRRPARPRTPCWRGSSRACSSSPTAWSGANSARHCPPPAGRTTSCSKATAGRAGAG